MPAWWRRWPWTSGSSSRAGCTRCIGCAGGHGAAGRLDGAITQANVDYLADTYRAGEAAALAESSAGTTADRATQGSLNTLAVLGREVVDTIPGGRLFSSSLSVLTEAVKGGVGMATIPEAPAGNQAELQLEEVRRANAENVERDRDLMLLRAMDMAGVFGADRPPILDAPEPTSSSEHLDSLASDVDEGLARWAVERGAQDNPLVPDPSAYSEARSDAYHGWTDGTGSTTSSRWSGDGADGMYYGDTGQGRRTPDPRDLDDPDHTMTPPR